MWKSLAWKCFGLSLFCMTLRMPIGAQTISLQAIVTPSTVVLKDGRAVTFAVHGFIEFKCLAELFPYIEGQKARWKDFSETRRESLGR